MIQIDQIQFNSEGLVPVVTQRFDTKEVLMLAYMNKDALTKTLDEKIAYYYSRSRQSLWKKGETSGHFQYVKSLTYDCDADALLMQVDQVGVACHTNKMSCFHNDLLRDDDLTQKSYLLEELYATIEERKKNPVEGSYTTYLFNKGIDKILKKVGEETAEVIIAAKNNDKTELTYEISDLVYHTMVLMIEQGVSLKDIETELLRRRK